MSVRSTKALVLGTTILVLLPLTTYAVVAKFAKHPGEPATAGNPPEGPAEKLSPDEGESGRPAAGAAQVTIDNFVFRPATLTIAAGAAVTWTNRDDVPHTATSTAKPRIFDSGVLDTDQQFSHVFSMPGTYDYFCAVHPHMTAQIIVK